jgi:MFS family permease
MSVRKKENEERLFSGTSGRLLLIVSVGWGSIQGGRLLLSPLLPRITSDLNISNTKAGAALTLLWGTYALLQFPSGRLSDQLSRKVLLVTGIFFVVSGFLTLTTTSSYLVLLAASGTVGIGAGLYPTAARALVADLFVERRGQAFGLHAASGDLGGGAAAGVAVVVVVIASWRVAFFLPVALLAVVLIGLHVWSYESIHVKPVSLKIRQTSKRLLSRRIVPLLFAYALFAFTWQSAVGFLPTYLQSKGLTETFASGSFALLFVVGILVKPLAGGLSDHFPPLQVSAGVLLLGAAGMTIVVGSSLSLLLALGVILFAAGVMAFPPVMQAYLMNVFPTKSMGGDLGGARTIYIGIGSLGPTYVGAVADIIGFEYAFISLIGCLLISGLVVFALDRSSVGDC